jgi:Ca2+-binding EF-hand superfamily protein
MDSFFKVVKRLQSKSSSSTLHSEGKLAASKFDNEEIALLKMTWSDLADRSNGKGIDKDTFLQYFPLNGLLGERLFVQFDTKKTGYIDFDEFIIGLSIACRGSKDDKIRFVFNMYDVSRDNTVSKQELTTLLNHVPKHVLQEYFRQSEEMPSDSRSVSSDGSASPMYVYTVSHDNVVIKRDSNLEEVDQYTNHDIVEKVIQHYIPVQ